MFKIIACIAATAVEKFLSVSEQIFALVSSFPLYSVDELLLNKPRNNCHAVVPSYEPVNCTSY